MTSPASIARLRTVSKLAYQYRCDIKRPGTSTPNGYNQPVPGALADHLLDVPCQWMTGVAGAGLRYQRTATSVQEEPTIRVDIDLDVNEADVINAVRDDRGNHVAGPLRIKQVKHAVVQKHLILTDVRAP